MREFQCFLLPLRRPNICYYIICMTIPLREVIFVAPKCKTSCSKKTTTFGCLALIQMKFALKCIFEIVSFEFLQVPSYPCSQINEVHSSLAESYSEPSWTFKVELFPKIVNAWKLLTIFCKTFHLSCLTRFSMHL